MKERAITMTEIKSCTVWSKKDNSPRGCKTVSNTEIKTGDYVVYNNRFTEVIDDPAEEIEEQENTTEEENTMNVYGEYFYGNKISEYGLEKKAEAVLMKVFYSVTTIVHDDGSVNAIITSSKSAEEKPESSFKSLSRKDIYVDWFDSYEEAAEFAEEAKKA